MTEVEQKTGALEILTEESALTTYKGFDKNLACRGYQFEVGKTYEHIGKVKACGSGFHACEYPLNVFGYYAPNASRFAVVKQFGSISRHIDDTKIASGRIIIEAEIKLPDLIAAAVKWVFDRAKWTDGPTATGDQGAASATGYQGAASATGYQGAASATGDQGAASATGKWGAASATGYQGAASATGYRGRVKGAPGNALFLIYRDPDDGSIRHVWAGIAGQNGIKPDAWYSLDSMGNPVEVES